MWTPTPATPASTAACSPSGCPSRRRRDRDASASVAPGRRSRAGAPRTAQKHLGRRLRRRGRVRRAGQRRRARRPGRLIGHPGPIPRPRRATMPYSITGRGGIMGAWGARDTRIFRDRADAGRQLAERLLHLREAEPVVLALPRGGVPVGYEIARELEAPLDVFLVRKIGAPGHRELGIGAIAQGGIRIFNETAIRMLGLSWADIDEIVREEEQELQRRLLRFRGDRPLPDLTGRTVVLVDDGLATGVTAL